MPSEPTCKRTIAFVDGQNLFHAAREAFGHPYPNYDVLKLSQRVCQQQGWQLHGVQFYTGMPDLTDNAFWHQFWGNKLAAMGRQGVKVYARALRYRNQTLRLPDGSARTVLVGQVKGIDIRIALDVVHAVHARLCDVALVFSQDQDLSEVAEEIRRMAAEQQRWVKIASAFPDSPTLRNRRGINKTDWVRMDRSFYDSCVDPRDYRPGKTHP